MVVIIYVVCWLVLLVGLLFGFAVDSSVWLCSLVCCLFGSLVSADWFYWLIGWGLLFDCRSALLMVLRLGVQEGQHPFYRSVLKQYAMLGIKQIDRWNSSDEV